MMDQYAKQALLEYNSESTAAHLGVSTIDCFGIDILRSLSLFLPLIFRGF